MKFWRTPFNVNEIETPKGEVHIIESRCKGCGYCIEYCPKKVLETSDSFNALGYLPPIVSHPDECVNCEICAMLCSEFAIWSTPDKKQGARNKK